MSRCKSCPPNFKCSPATAAIVVLPPHRTPNWSCRSTWHPGCPAHYLTHEKRSSTSYIHCTCRAVPDTAAVREVGLPPRMRSNAVLDLARVSPKHTQPTPNKPMIGDIPDSVIVVSLAVAQAITLTGSLVGGKLARKRRLEMEKLNDKLRQVVHELRKQKEAEVQSLVCVADPDEGMSAYQRALEASLLAPAAAHPQETYGVEGISLASTRRKIAKLLLDAKADLDHKRPGEAELKCTDALVRCEELADKRASRAVLRVMGRAQRSLLDYKSAIHSLNKALKISESIGDSSGDVDTLGMIADVYVEMGDFERAAAIYDDVLNAIQNEDDTSVLSSTWDC
eukprot:jgi/Ulvmu1/4628/UM002_0359.1